MNDELAQAILASAQRIGADPVDLATVASYETGGKLNPETWGGAGGNHFGMIQFGPAEREKYGVKPGMPLADHMGAVERYLVDRGFKPGMGILDLYSTINAGRPGLYNRSDAANGGAPGTVADKVNQQMAGHRVNAERLLGISGQPPATAAPAPVAQSAPMGSVPPSMALPVAGNSATPTDEAFMAALKMIAQRGNETEAEDEMPLIDFNFKQPPGIARMRANIKRRG